MPSKSPASSFDILIGRIDVRLLAPPMTIAIITGHISELESIQTRDILAIRLNVEDEEPADGHLKITLNPGDPGSTEDNPLAVSIRIPPFVTTSATSSEALQKQQAETHKPMRSLDNVGFVLTSVKPKGWRTAKVIGHCELLCSASFAILKGRELSDSLLHTSEKLPIGTILYVNVNKIFQDEGPFEYSSSSRFHCTNENIQATNGMRSLFVLIRVLVVRSPEPCERR